MAFASEQLVAVLAAIQDSSPPIRESLASLPWRTLRRTVGFVVSSSLSATAVIAPSVNGRRWTTSAIEQPRCAVKLFWNGGYRSNAKLSNEDARCISW